ncbi:MAG: 3-isopropylmalate dehydratase small subunit [Desulfotomaculum sp.]|nr:3-isopropylmalate dehydratase small subunit [Desulfotomaculum sp.]
MQFSGKVHKFDLDDINTDYIISGKYKFKTLDMRELAKHVMEDLDPEFYAKITAGDFMVAGNNFGCGSSREQAPLAIKNTHIAAVLAKSFAHIFYRNAINTGLPLVECDTSKIEAGDQLELDISKGIVKNITQGIEIKAQPLPGVMIKILNDGGLAAHFRKYKGFNLAGC